MRDPFLQISTRLLVANDFQIVNCLVVQVLSRPKDRGDWSKREIIVVSMYRVKVHLMSTMKDHHIKDIRDTDKVNA